MHTDGRKQRIKHFLILKHTFRFNFLLLHDFAVVAMESPAAMRVHMHCKVSATHIALCQKKVAHPPQSEWSYFSYGHFQSCQVSAGIFSILFCVPPKAVP
jgi:hypothetical protein